MSIGLKIRHKTIRKRVLADYADNVCYLCIMFTTKSSVCCGVRNRNEVFKKSVQIVNEIA